MNKAKLKHLFWIVPLLAIVLVIIFTSFFTVGENERAVVTTFGKVSSVRSAGLQFKFPFPIQDMVKVDMTTRKMTLGYESSEEGSEVSVEDAKMITGDYNVVAVDFFMEWKVSDPEKYLFASSEPDGILKNVAYAAARDVMGAKGVDDILTTGKVEIQAQMKDLITERLDEYDIGIQLLDVKLQDAEPPTEEVTAAFKDVETAKQEKETAINVAKAYENSVIPEANAEADKILKDAEAYKEQRINEANGAAARFTAMYNEYILNPDITKKRMYLEMIEDVLPDVEVYIDTSAEGTLKILPLSEFVKEGE